MSDTTNYISFNYVKYRLRANDLTYHNIHVMLSQYYDYNCRYNTEMQILITNIVDAKFKLNYLSQTYDRVSYLSYTSYSPPRGIRKNCPIFLSDAGSLGLLEILEMHRNQPIFLENNTQKIVYSGS